jgi:hypothetical protein
LPGLPWQFWNEGALQAIGNSLGVFIVVDTEALAAGSRKIGRVLVEMDIHQGLLGEIGNRMERLTHDPAFGLPRSSF